MLFCLGPRRPDLQSFRIGFALPRTIGVSPGCTTGWLQHGARMQTDASLPLSRSLVLAALLVTAAVSMVALAPSQRDAVRRH